MTAPADPFAALGLPPDPELADDDVRAAWRRIAAATHPDRDDGGDLAQFAAASAAYTALRTRLDRTEVLADMAGAAAGQLWSRVRRGRPLRLAARALVAAAVIGGAWRVAGDTPAWPALAVGAVTWLILTGRHELTR